MNELEIKVRAEQYALSRIVSTDLSTQARDKILIQDAYEKGFNVCYAILQESAMDKGEAVLKENKELKSKLENLRKYLDMQNSYRECAEIWEKFIKARETIRKIEKIFYSGENALERLSKISDILEEAEQFLSEVEE